MLARSSTASASGPRTRKPRSLSRNSRSVVRAASRSPRVKRKARELDPGGLGEIELGVVRNVTHGLEHESRELALPPGVAQREESG
jgi:hypothetical protein